MRLHIMGPLRATESADGPDLLPNTKAKFLLAFLARKRVSVETRRTLAEMFWPDEDLRRAFASLRQSIRAIRRLENGTGRHIIDPGKETIGLTDDALETDVAVLTEALRSGTAHEIAEAGQSWDTKILPGASTISDDFEEWACIEATAIRDEFIRVAIRRLDAIEPVHEDPALAQALCNFVLSVEPAHEDTHLRLIGFHARNRDRWDALAQYKRYVAATRSEFDLPPSPDAVRLISALDDQGDNRHPVTEIGRPILAFQVENREAKSHRAIEMSVEELVHRLSAFSHLSLSPPISRSDPSQQSGQWIGKLSAKDKPNADFLLSLKPSADNRCVLLEVTDQIGGRILLHDRIEISELSKSEAIGEILGWRAARIERLVVNAVLEHDAGRDTVISRWAEAVDLITRFDAGSNNRALTLLEETMSGAGARFAPGHAAIASIRLKQRLHAPDLGKAANLEAAKSRIEDALSIDPWDAFSHRIAGWTSFQQKDFETGLKHFATSVELNSSEAYGCIAASEALAYTGQIARAHDYAARGFRLMRPAPPYFNSYLATLHFASSDYETCVDLCDRGPTESAEVQILKAAALGCMGRGKEAASLIARLRPQAHSGRDADLSDWLADINMFQFAPARLAFIRGLEAAGLSAIRNRFEARAFPR